MDEFNIIPKTEKYKIIAISKDTKVVASKSEMKMILLECCKIETNTITTEQKDKIDFTIVNITQQRIVAYSPTYHLLLQHLSALNICSHNTDGVKSSNTCLHGWRNGQKCQKEQGSPHKPGVLKSVCSGVHINISRDFQGPRTPFFRSVSTLGTLWGQDSRLLSALWVPLS